MIIKLTKPASAMVSLGPRPVIGADRVGDAGESVGPQARRKFAFDAADQARSLVDQRGVELHQRRASPNLAIGVAAAGNAADTDEGEATFGERVHVTQDFGREREQRPAAEAARLAGISALQP